MKYLFILTCICTVHMALAQPQSDVFLRKSTEKQLSAIFENARFQSGMMAVDLTSGETFAFNENAVFAQASAIKIPILMEVYKQASQKKFNLTDVRNIDSATVVGGSGVIQALVDPVALSIRNIAVLMITLSDNTATNSLINLVGMDHINATMNALGFKQTKVQRKMIDSAASARGDENISTPAEAARILQLLYQGTFVDKKLSQEIVDVLRKTPRTGSRIAKGLPEQVQIAYKPGGIAGVSTEWAIVFLPGRPYAVALMENYKMPGDESNNFEQVSKVLYNYYWRLGNSTTYGTYK